MSYEYGKVTIQLRHDTAANFSSVDPVLISGEPAYAIDTKTLKIGDGSTSWSSLSPLINGSGNIVSDTGIASGGNIITNIVSISTAEYAALSGSYHPTTLYFVTGT